MLKAQRSKAPVLFLLSLILSASVRYSAAQTESLDSYRNRTFTSISGVAVSVISGGKIVFENGYGYADSEKKTLIDRNTRFELASVTKQITAMAVMMQKEAGRFRFDSPITEFFPEFSGFAQGATVRNLLQHTARFPDYSELCAGPGPARNGDVVNLLVKKARLDFKPEARHSYSNTGYDLLAVLVEKTSGLSYPDFLEQKIFKPLGMNDTFVNRWSLPSLPNTARSYRTASAPAKSPDIVNCNTIYGDGSVFSTAHDMALWNLYLEKNLVVGTAASMDEAYRPGTTTSGATFPYGFGWSLGDRRGMKEYAHTGGWAGYHTLNDRFPEKRFAVVVLTNGPRADLDAVVTKAIAEHLHR